MISIATYAVAALASAATPAEQVCPELSKASAIATRIAGLPPAISDDLGQWLDKRLVEADGTAASKDVGGGTLINARFVQGVRIESIWFVSYAIGGTDDIRTIGYLRDEFGRFRRSPLYYFSGPTCATIRAALAGVRTPGGFNF